MCEAEPTIQTMKVTNAREHWNQLTDAVFRRKKRVLLEKAGIPVAALIPIEDLERLQRYDAEREADFAVLREIGAAFKDVPADEIEREVAKALEEVRAERRAQTLEQTHPRA